MKTLSLVCMTLGACALAGTGCSSLKIVEGNLAPPKWVGDPSAITNYEPHAFIYSSGISTYSSVLEEGINDVLVVIAPDVHPARAPRGDLGDLEELMPAPWI